MPKGRGFRSVNFDDFLFTSIGDEKKEPTNCNIISLVNYANTLLEFRIRRLFLLINIVQLVYILASFAINKERRNFTINKREFKAISMELLLIVALFFAASITKNSEILLLVLFVLLLIVWLGLFWNIFKLGQDLFTFPIINLYGLLSTFVVLRSNLYARSLTYNLAMQQIIWSCIITYLIHIIFLVLKYLLERNV